MFGFKIIAQYEKGIVFRFGRALPGIREAGLTWVNAFTSRLRKVNMQIIVAAVPGQEAITRDNVTLRVDAVVYYRVIDPIKAIINVQNYKFAVSEVAQTRFSTAAQPRREPAAACTSMRSSPRMIRRAWDDWQRGR